MFSHSPATFLPILVHLQLQLEERGRGGGRSQRTTGISKWPLYTHFVALRVGQDRVLRGQGNAAGCDHQEDAHLKVAQVHDVVAGPPDPVGWMRPAQLAPLSWALVSPLPIPLTPSTQPRPLPYSQTLSRGSRQGEQFNFSGTTLHYQPQGRKVMRLVRG